MAKAILVVCALVPFFTTAATAAPFAWVGTLRLESAVVSIPIELLATGGGVATVNGSGGGLHLTRLRLEDGISGATSVPMTDPDLATIFTAFLTASLGTGTVFPTPGTQGVIPVAGALTLCVFFTGCPNYIPIPLTMFGTAGVGIGGTVTVNTFSPAPLKFSITGAPWTVGTTSITSVSVNGVTTTVVAQGFVHAPASGTSTTAAAGGVIQLVSPSRIVSQFGGAPIPKSMLGVLTIRIIPEPGAGILLAAGVAGLVVLGLRRASRQ